MSDDEPPTEPGVFHIHIDAQQLPDELNCFALEQLGFAETNFSGHPPGFEHFEPNRHLTLKLTTKAAFETAWRRLEAAADRPDFVGYLEGEYIVTDEAIEYRPFRDIEAPFHVERRRLSGAPAEQFRQSELHLVYRREDSDPRLSDTLLRAGLYGAYIPKADGEYLVLTAQGFVRDIEPLHRAVRDFIKSAGGAVRCTLKEERAIRHKLAGVTSLQLPQIVAEARYR